MAGSSLRGRSGRTSAEGTEQGLPASLTAMASALNCTPAIGAWTIGSSMPMNSCSVIADAALGENTILTEDAHYEVRLRHSARRLGARFRDLDHGHLLRDDPQPAAPLSRRRA